MACNIPDYPRPLSTARFKCSLQRYFQIHQSREITIPNRHCETAFVSKPPCVLHNSELKTKFTQDLQRLYKNNVFGVVRSLADFRRNGSFSMHIFRIKNVLFSFLRKPCTNIHRYVFILCSSHSNEHTCRGFIIGCIISVHIEWITNVLQFYTWRMSTVLGTHCIHYTQF